MKKFFLLLLIISLRLHSQTYVLIPDANFRAYLQGIVPTALNGFSLDITNTLVTTATQTIDASWQSISDLTGAQYFNSLTTLKCTGNSLLSLPSLPNNLQYLKCDFNPITNLPLLPSSLIELRCAADSLTTLPSLPSGLQYLDCAFNKIKCFPIFPTSLTTIYLSSNPYNCLPNYVLPAMSIYTTTPLCALGNSNGCPPGVGIKELKLDDLNVKVFPNPASNQLIIETLTIESAKVQIFDLNNRLLYSQGLSEKNTIDLSDFNSGIYNLTIRLADKIANKKLVVVH